MKPTLRTEKLKNQRKVKQILLPSDLTLEGRISAITKNGRLNSASWEKNIAMEKLPIGTQLKSEQSYPLELNPMYRPKIDNPTPVPIHEAMYSNFLPALSTNIVAKYDPSS